MFSEAALDHFQNPRNSGELAGATHRIEATNPVCGDVLQLFARIEGEVVREISFLCRGCTTAIACASLLTEELKNNSIARAEKISSHEISEKLGKLPPATLHAAHLAATAARKLAEAAKHNS